MAISRQVKNGSTNAAEEQNNALIVNGNIEEVKIVKTDKPHR